MIDSQTRVGVVGLGSFGRHHARHLATHRGARLAALADVDLGRARQAAAEFGGEAFVDHLSLLGKVDAVTIAVPASRHAAVARDFLSAGIHVLIEKPIATDGAAARDLIARAERAGVVLQVGHIERFSPVVREMHKRVSEPRRVAAVRRAVWSGRGTDVDVILDLMIHDIDHVLAFAGGVVATVAASGASVRSGFTDEAEAWLTFASGVVATLSASRVADEPVRRLTLTEVGLVFTADLAEERLSIASRGRASRLAEAIALDPHDSLGAEIDAFLTAVRTGGPPVVDGRAGLAAVEVAERIQAAIAETEAPSRRSADA